MSSDQIINIAIEKYGQKLALGISPKMKNNLGVLYPGMQNLGNTCFANSVLQCLVHTNYIFAYCAQSFHSKHCNSRISHEVFEESQRSSKVSYKDRNPNYECSSVIKGESQRVKQIIQNNPLIKVALDNQNFCSFCVLENHVKTTIFQRN